MRRLMWAVGVLAVAGAGVAVATVAGAESGGQYRVATASVGDVSQTVPVSGTVDRVNRADVSFGTNGTVASLSVAVGDSVSAGQELGTLDKTSSQAAVDKAQADLDQAEADLSTAETAAEETTSTSVVDEVKDAQSAASAALRAASDAVAAQEAACADPASAACASAGSATLTAQQAVKAAQDTLQAKLNALSAEQPSSDSGPSASSVAEAQAAVDEATVKLVEAQQTLAATSLVSPITGTVASVSAGVGDQATAGTAVVVVVGEGAAEVTATVPVEQLSKLAAGQRATVTPVGTSEKVDGKVTRVGTLPDLNAETVAYPVTITVAEPPPTLAAGSSATASIVVATAENVLTVPTSAVNRGTVTVLAGDQPTVTRVTVGAVGPTRTEIKEGVSAGDQVVLANLDTPLPTSDQQSTGPGGFMDGSPNGGGGGGPGGGPMIRTRPGN